MEANMNGDNSKLKLLVTEFQKEYKKCDERFNTLEKSLDKLTHSIDLLVNSLDELKGYWGQSIPIRLVYFIVALVVAGQTAITVLRFFLPVP
jgi:hypothetical protein